MHFLKKSIYAIELEPFLLWEQKLTLKKKKKKERRDCQETGFGFLILSGPT